MTDEDSFLQRWSRRKTAEKSREQPIADTVQDAAAVTVASAPDPEPEVEPVAPEDLPDIESLDKSSDFSVFMRAGVPEELKKLALRRLWLSDPIFNEVDGLVEYGEDFTKVSLAAVNTIFQIGKGMVTDEDADQLAESEGEGDGDAADETEQTVAVEDSEAAAETDAPEEPEITS